MAPTASDGVTVKLTVPAVVGVPLTVMALVPLPVIVRPEALLTLDTVSVTGPEPPAGTMVWLKRTPTSPAGSVAGAVVAAGATAIAYCRVNPVPRLSVVVTLNCTTPAAVGTPETAMVLVPLPANVRPAGLLTLETVSVTGPVPPTGVIVWA